MTSLISLNQDYSGTQITFMCEHVLIVRWRGVVVLFILH